MQTIDVVNKMLGTMGERPLTSLEDSHALLPAATSMLTQTSRMVQAKGWWFNDETVTLSPNVTDGYFYLPNDCLSIQTVSADYVKRGSLVYNLAGGTFVISDPILTVILRRFVAFEDLPEEAAQYIAAVSVAMFQTDYDGDVAKGRVLQAAITEAKIEFQSANTRARKANLITSNSRLQQLKFITSQARQLLR